MQHNYKDKQKSNKKGFTMAEALIVIGIIAVLAALIVVAVFAYLRSLKKLEYDGYAKEMLIAAQNHLSMAESEGYLGRTDFGSAEDPQVDSKDGVYYFVKDSSHPDVYNGNSLLDLMLPFASIDETVRVGGCYIVRYHKETATVLDVFYWEESGRYAHTFTDADYAKFLGKRNEKSELRTYEGDSSVIGWYGGAEAQNLTHGNAIPAPLLTVTNADQLKVNITDKSTDGDNVILKLIITGLTSTNKKEITIDRSNTETEIILDDITEGKHFSQLFCTGDNALIPGEDITLQLVEYNNAELTNIAYSPIVTTNSLFAYNDVPGDNSAHISYIRHLENLDPAVSNLNTTDEHLKYVTGGDVTAKQTTDLTWDTEPTSNPYLKITNASGTELVNGTFKPVDTSYKLLYDGQGFAINSIVVNASGSAGLFSDLTDGDTVQNLKLIDSSITGNNAGALAGTADNATVENVVVYNSGSKDSSTTVTITGTANAGGLIGFVSDSDISRTAAAVIVESSGNAGGLIGTASGGTIDESYSGGHTEKGSYRDVTYIDTNDENKVKIKYNVTGGTNAGGLIGQATSTDSKELTVSNCYSTCSAKGTTTGGLIGDATRTASKALTVTNCYSTGLVEGTSKGAFIGNLVDGSLASCLYYDIINEQFANGTDGKSGYTYLKPVGNQETSDINEGGVKISAFDETARTYEAFVGDNDGTEHKWQTAVAYDQNLNIYYQGKYNLKTVDQLSGSTDTDLASKHYGDWPSPEIWAINEPN